MALIFIHTTLAVCLSSDLVCFVIPVELNVKFSNFFSLFLKIKMPRDETFTFVWVRGNTFFLFLYRKKYAGCIAAVNLLYIFVWWHNATDVPFTVHLCIFFFRCSFSSLFVYFFLKRSFFYRYLHFEIKNLNFFFSHSHCVTYPWINLGASWLLFVFI